MKNEEKLSLVNLKSGAAVELFDLALQKVLDNIADINTKSDAKREITLKVIFKPTYDREGGKVEIECAAKLASAPSVGSILYFGKDETGRGVAVEHNPKQPTFAFNVENEQ